MAANAGGTSYGADATFSSLPGAPAALTGAASAITQTTATLGASVDPNGGLIESCVFEWGALDLLRQRRSVRVAARIG